MLSLKNYSDKELVRRLRELVRKEQDLTLEILPFLAEVDRRGLYLKWGYGSLTDYCISHLRYCESSAWRRVCAARVVRDFPEVHDMLLEGRLTFSAVIAAAKVLKKENVEELLPRLFGKSQCEVKLIVAEYETPKVIPDQARPRIVMKPGAKQTSNKLTTEQSSVKVGEIPLRSEGKKLTTDEKSTPAACEFEKMYEIRFAADEELMELIRWAKSYLSSRYPGGVGFLEVFKYVLKYVREREDLERRAARRKESNAVRKLPKSRDNSRHIPQQVKEKVWTRNRGRCAYVGENGRRCNSTHNLQFDHYPVPYARGGPNTASNLRLLCAKHNKFSAEQVYGKQHVQRFVSRRE